MKASFDAGVQCFIWSSLPSSAQISGGRLVSKIYEGNMPVTPNICAIFDRFKENIMSTHTSKKSDFLPVFFIPGIFMRIWSFGNTSPMTSPVTLLHFATQCSGETQNVSASS